MKKKELIDLRSKEVKVLNKMILDKKTEIEKNRVKVFSGKQKNFSFSRNLRREVSQLMTLVKEKQIMEKLTGKNNKKGAETI